MAEWAEEILQGVDSVPKIGVPGIIEIKDPRVKPIITGKSIQDVLLAAAEYGEGRLVVFSHDGYLQELTQGKSMEKLMDNLKLWLTKGTWNESNLTTDVSRADSLSGYANKCGILLWDGKDEKPGIFYSEILDFLARGGGLILGMCPWGWVQTHPGKKLNMMPMYHILDRVGLSFTDKYIDVEGKDFDTSYSSSGKQSIIPTFPFWKNNPGICRGFPRSRVDLNVLQSKQKENITSILRGGETVPMVGTPGSIMVYGHHAYPVVTGENGTDVLLAVAEYGAGRIAVFSHDGYVHDFLTQATGKDSSFLMKNLKDWLYQGSSPCSTGGIKEINLDGQCLSPKTLKDCRILVQTQELHHEEQVHQAIIEYVYNGGGLVLGQCPWGWLSLQSEKGLEDMPSMDIMKAVGLCYTNTYFASSGNVPVSPDLAVDAHVGVAMTLCSVDPSLVEKYGNLICHSLDQLPLSIRCNFQAEIQTILDHYDETIEMPTAEKPVTDRKAKSLLVMYQGQTEMTEKEGVKLRGIDKFPGDFQLDVSTVTVDVKVTSDAEELHPTGYYLPAGRKLTITILDQTDNTPAWSVLIGSHTDDLTGNNSWRRWPKITKQKKLKEKKVTVHALFGGLIYLKSPKSASNIAVRLHEVVESPRYDAKDEVLVNSWQQRRYSPGLWADLSGQYITFTLPSSSTVTLDDPGTVLKYWDQVVLAYHELRGTDVTQSPRQWVVTDEQPSAGYMHAGYPIVTHLDVARSNPDEDGMDNFLLNLKALTARGNWGLFHEIGHNMQRSEWTFTGTGEVTCNIFTLYAMNTIVGSEVITHPWVAGQMNNMRKFLGTGAIFETWQSDPGVALGIYAQLAEHCGWGSFKKVFRQYENLAGSERPSTDQDKIDQWITRFSKVTGYDLSPLFEFWGIPFSNNVKDHLNGLLPYLPDDVITDMAPDRVAEILSKKEFKDIKRKCDVRT